MDRKRRYVHALFIYFNLWNKAAAPMWRLGFNQEVREGVQRFSHSPSQHEKSALKALNQFDLLEQTVERRNRSE